MKKLYIIFAILTLMNSTVRSQNGWFFQSSPSPDGYNSVYFTDYNTGWAVGSMSTIIKTTNGGTNWTLQSSGTIVYHSVFFVDHNTGWVVGGAGTIIKTTNGGTNWSSQSIGTNQRWLSVYFADNNTGWAVYPLGIIKTTNGGINWTPSGDITDLNSIKFLDNNTGWAVGFLSTIIKTTNGGVSWLSQISPTSNQLFSVDFINNNTGFAVGVFGTIIKTTNGGTNWTLVSSGTGNNLYSVDFVDNVTAWVVGVGGKIIKTTNGGTSWTSQSNFSGVGLKSVNFIDNNIGWTVGTSILKTTTGGEPVGVWNISSEIPMNFELSQNFPNPFNPSTNIAFLVSKYSNVKINVYDSQGKEVVTLLNERLSAGSYRVDFDGTGYSSGIYFYKMETEDFVQTKSMVLLK